MPTGNSVTITGLDEVQARLKKITAASGLPSVVGKAVVAGIRRTFDIGEDPNTGQKWTPLKSRRGSPLLDTRKFQRSFTYAARKTSVTVGTNFAWAKVHNYGMTITPKKGKFLKFEVFGTTIFARQVTIPARPFLPESDDALDRVTDGLLIPALTAYFMSMAEK